MDYKGNDFYCDLVLSKKIEIKTELETDNVLAFYHTKPSYPVHIVVIPKRHISSLITLTENDNDIFLELFSVIKKLAAKVNEENGQARVFTNVGNYQDSKHLHFHVVSGNLYKK